MKIASVVPIHVEGYLFVEVTTDSGLVGLGEAGAWGFHEATATAIEKFAEYLDGQDPLRIEHHWQYMYRWTHFGGSVVMAAISAIDIALWDIAGKHFDAPIHALLGGKIRERARVYYHVFGKNIEELCDGIEAARSEGYTAVGHLTPFVEAPPSQPPFEAHSRKMHDAVNAVRRYREVAGPDMDLCIELHRQLKPFEAVQLGLAIEPYFPLFIEDPTTADNIDEMAYIASKVNVPIATGERFTSLWDFQMLLARGAAQIVRPDVCLVGGITGARKVAALAEANHVGVVPHNPLSPVSTAACLQIAAIAPNFLIQEFPSESWPGVGANTRPPSNELVVGSPEHDGEGFLRIRDEPGHGISLRPGVAEKFPHRFRKVRSRLQFDGSVVDH